MKKIIYSLVMLVALGGLFTSCIKNDEPAGIKELRYAKADYIRALADLSKANEAVVAAEAAYKQAQADHEGQLAALVTAQINLENQKAELQKLQNEAQKIANDHAKAENALKEAKLQAAIDQQKALDAKELEAKVKELELMAKENELAIARINDEIKDIENNAKVKAVQSEEALAKAQADLQNTLKGIEAYAMLLTEDEADVVGFAARVYEDALQAYNEALADYTNAVAETYIKNYDANNLPKGLEKDLAKAKEELAEAQALKAKYADVNGDAASWKAELDGIEEQIKDASLALTETATEWAYAQSKYRMCYDAFKEALQNILEAKAEEYMGKIGDAAKDAEASVELPKNNDYIMNQFRLYINPFLDEGMLDLDGNTLSINFTPWSNDADEVLFTDCLKANQDSPIGLVEIIETFKREKVIVDNEGQAAALEAAKTAADDALAIYNAHKDTLEKGFAAYAPLVAAQTALKAAQAKFTEDSAALVKAKADSVAAENAAKTAKTAKDAAAQTAYDNAVKAANAKAKADSAAAVAAQEAKANNLLEGAEKFAYNINYYYKTIGGNPMDTAKVFAAIKEYAAFLKENGATHTAVNYYDGKDVNDEDIVKTVEIADLTLDEVIPGGKINTLAYDNFQGIGTGSAHNSVSNAMSYLVKVLKNDYTWDAYTDIDPSNLQINGTLITVLAAAETASDNADLLKAYLQADKDKTAAITAAEKAKTDALKANLTEYENVCKAEHNKVAAAQTKVNNDNIAVSQAKAKVEAAAKAFADIYDAFWGFADGTHAANIADYTAKTFLAPGEDSLAVTYTFNTFEQPHNVVFVNAAFDEILPYNFDLTIILANLANTTSESEIASIFADPTIPYIFYNDQYNELADIYFTKAKYEYLSQFEQNVKTLEALEKAVNELVAAYDVFNGKVENIYNDILKDVKTYTGIEVAGLDDTENLMAAFDIMGHAAQIAWDDTFTFENFTDNAVKDGEYIGLGTGDILALAKECFNEATYGDYATKLQAWVDSKDDATKTVADLNELYYYLDKIYTMAIKLDIDSSLTGYTQIYDAFMEYLDDEVADAEWNVYELQKAYDIMMAGADALTVNKQIAEDWLKYQEEKLANAKTFLDASKAQYDAVIAKYLTK